jgi:hypothetical protein
MDSVEERGPIEVEQGKSHVRAELLAQEGQVDGLVVFHQLPECFSLLRLAVALLLRQLPREVDLIRAADRVQESIALLVLGALKAPGERDGDRQQDSGQRHGLLLPS